jgi:uncharacterized membrane protein
MKWKRLLTATALSAALLLPMVGVMAAANTDPTGLNATAGAAGFNTDPGAPGLPLLIYGIINVIISVLGVLLFLYFFWGGYTWMTASGDSKQVSTAKDRIKNATIGLIIVLGSWALSSFVLGSIINTTVGTN